MFGETLETLTEAVKAAGYPAFRAKQVMEWLYKKRVEDWSAMTNLPKAFRAWLDASYILYPTQPLLDKRSDDVTQKFLLELEDRSLIETVLIRAPKPEWVRRSHAKRSVCRFRWAVPMDVSFVLRGLPVLSVT